MPLDQRLLSLLGQPGYVPLTVESIASELGLKKKETNDLRRTVHRLLDQGVVAKVKKNKLVLPNDADLVSGTMRFRQSGAAILIPDNPQERTLLIRAEDTAVALHGDKVLVRRTEEPEWKQRRFGRGRSKGKSGTFTSEPTGRVIRVLQRKNLTLTGTLKRAKLFYFVIPDDPRIIQDVLVPPPEQSGLDPLPEVDDKVVVELHEWKQRHMNPEGEITEILGKTHEPFAEFKAILHKFKLNPEFPDDVMQEVRSIPDKVLPEQTKGRLDFRNKLTFTIDPDDAKDFDDALSLEYMKDGNLEIGVHIADVSSYVRWGTALDREAKERGNSTYLVGQVIPMLPHALSNGICSLVENEDRLTKSVIFTMSPQGEILKTLFASTVIRSFKRMTYHQAYALLQENDLNAIRATPLPPAHQTGSTGRPFSELSDAELTKLQKAVRTLWSIASHFRKERFKAGSLDLDMPEVKIFVDEQGYADRMETIEYDESHQLIEEYMLAANEAVAKAFFEAGMATISRVHDKPDAEKLNELRENMLIAGMKCGDLSDRKEANRLLAKIAEHPQSHTLKIQFLRSLKQACYRAEYDGHYGLAKTFYLHFTSPIRRYSDLVVHRQFDDYLLKHKLPGASPHPIRAYNKSELQGMASHLSITEQQSTEAERESVKIKLLEFFERELAKEKKSLFDAVITDIKNHGMFIELTESMAFGLIHVSTLQDDLYRIEDHGAALVGRRTGNRFTIGQHISVITERVDRFKRQIDFRVAGDGTPAPDRSRTDTARYSPPGKKNKKDKGPNRKQGGKTDKPSRKKPSKARRAEKRLAEGKTRKRNR